MCAPLGDIGLSRTGSSLVPVPSAVSSDGIEGALVWVFSPQVDAKVIDVGGPRVTLLYEPLPGLVAVVGQTAGHLVMVAGEIDACDACRHRPTGRCRDPVALTLPIKAHGCERAVMEEVDVGAFRRTRVPS